ncbi:DUF488 domain-containing protein [Tenuibacillus multivorans]|uniref:Uncharacterized conserved protein YeaO, DUF488 family n=1 Tax=Tenuibacillus multivorans TaxID=237069 RepID=A0A1H0AX48_9BACI|nr:DUF488 family protein [Tenuibacillus multivorans]GEL77629.1 hypothetical protein TMU01_18640 [Tenuibacillus multivorans]SDN38034.1 Uncharacterized conserved protein YeaO, DUF488 family [Tenuibacillus multivorans]
MTVLVKRIYEDVSDQDGKRILVDRIWPRGVSKEKAQLDEWLKSVAPSTDLRKWFRHDPDKFEEFKKKYKQELEENEDQHQSFLKLTQYASNHTVTLLYSSKEETYNHAQVLKRLLE